MIRYILTASLLILVSLTCASQKDPGKSYLEKTGVVDILYSEILNENREIYIELPDGFQNNGSQQYPVVYILDGEVLLPTVKNVQSFYSGGFTPEMILVGISNAENRVRDLTTSTINEKYGMPFNEENGKAEAFLQFMEKELIPFIENKYPVTQFRTLIGHSYGGLFTIYSLIHHPELFSNYLAIDPSLDWDDQKLLEESNTKLATQDYKGKSLFMSLNGQLSMLDPEMTLENVVKDSTDFTVFPRSNIAFADMVREHSANELDFDWKFYPRDLHGTIAFPSIMDGMIATFDWYQMENTDKFNSPETSNEELFEIVKYRAQKLEDRFGYQVAPYPEELLTILGDMSLDMEQFEKSKMFLDFSLEYYPESSSPYHFMSKYYESTGDFEKALEFATKAYELNPDDTYKSRMESLKRQ
ncbi:hypothetical protein SAMN05192588_0043 [Nonlabens sp. Hel1_33_55]|uniref:alpha/beta hydrolase-fold protein n=1 Tax=Nonlabens sp. Hel1_33_55 TaxID=1336802 RepID=UPI000875F105|nr:alpha/beta hydrolase-fold protein [Nonlabens sp. Hel1_33_55]SCX87539.1 hypothetical protein SAMN05192588_0043 [Nonlabens sp. Hel1_33_55]